MKEIAEAAGASPRGMASLLDALTAIGYLRKTGSRYSLQPVSAAFLVPGGKAYVGAISSRPFAHLGRLEESDGSGEERPPR